MEQREQREQRPEAGPALQSHKINGTWLPYRPPYTRPTVTTHTEEELLAALGPAQAGSVGGDNVFGQ